MCSTSALAQTPTDANASEPPGAERSLKLPIWVWAAGAAADQATTYAFSSRYHDMIREQNPMLRGLDHNPALLVGVGSAMDAGSFWLSRRLLRGHPRLARVVFYSAAAYRIYLAGHNIHMMKIAGDMRARRAAGGVSSIR